MKLIITGLMLLGLTACTVSMAGSTDIEVSSPYIEKKNEKK